MHTSLQHNFKVVCLLLFQIKGDFSWEHILETLIQNALVPFSHAFDFFDQALLELIVSSFDFLVPAVPILAIQFIEEASVLNDQDRHAICALPWCHITHDYGQWVGQQVV